jgi:transposase-like protein
MTDERTEKEILACATAATTRQCTVRLDELKLLPERYCHREDDELKPENLELFMDSLILEKGIQVAVVYSMDAQLQKFLTAGHRRVIGARTLADRNQPGFTHDMEIKAIEVLNATPLDLLIGSVSDNENRKSPSPTRRLRTVKALHDAGAEVKRAARALGVADQTYQRDLQIVQYGWMYQHVEDGSIAPTVANRLLEAAEEMKRIKEVKEDRDEWIAAKKKELKDKARQYKADTNGKELRPAELQVKNHMLKRLVDHWIECIQARHPFDDKVEWDFPSSIDKDGRLQVSALNADGAL